MTERIRWVLALDGQTCTSTDFIGSCLRQSARVARVIPRVSSQKTFAGRKIERLLRPDLRRQQTRQRSSTIRWLAGRAAIPTEVLHTAAFNHRRILVMLRFYGRPAIYAILAT